MDTKKVYEAKIFANEIRIETLKELSCIGNGHLGGSLDLAEILAVLYSDVLKVDHKNPENPDRDYFVLSKGHAGPALYATLALRGFFPMEELKTLNQPHTNLPSHCDRLKTRGVDMTAGSLGQGIGAAVGIALGNQLAGRDNYTYCIVGDGEMDEGSVWEALLIAPTLKLSRLVVMVDNNGLQIDGPTAEINNLGDISKKAAEFGWFTVEADGNDVESVSAALALCKKANRPSFINFHTIKGKCWDKYENQVGCHWVGSIKGEEIREPIAVLEKQILQWKENL